MTRCRCCGGETAPAFTGKVLRKYPATYVACRSCQSLQVVDPHWLDEAYANTAAADALDSGAAWRNATAVRFIKTVVPLLSVGPWVDFGSGQGLLERALAKLDLSITSYDPLRGVRNSLPKACALVCCFEVLEHQTKPAEFMRSLAKLLSDDGVIVLSTWLRNPAVHGSTWQYLALDGGQHVSFPSRKGFEALCQQAGLDWWSTAVSQEHADFQIHVLSKRSSQPIEVKGFSVIPGGV